ncbi:MAG TPA: M20/M25/M40 family metallo-hydrolase [Longimicrobium sp.]|nr:M20/M25/M40 family metallo-hydrolase [Longimicrobium sp.]
MMRSLPLPIALLLLAVPAAAQPEPARPIDWAALQAEAVQVLSEYIRINTTNPPGNEKAGAEYLARILRREGIEAQILDEEALGPGRANLYARVRGDGSKRAIALVHHIDVVPASPQHWTVDPFAGLVRDGYVWGRGAIDMKGDGVAHLMAMLALKRSGVRLTRDIVYIANADEELGSTGAVAFVDRHPDLLRDVEFLITEGGDIPIENGRLQFYGVGVAEKRTFWQRLRIAGTPSHASRPTRENPVPRLVQALARIAQYETPLEVTAGVEKYFRDISRNYQDPQRAWLADVRTALADPAAREWILSDVYWNAILRNTISLTVVTGSSKTNVIPAEAVAEIDIRLLPTANPDSVLATLKALAADSGISWQTIMAPKTPLENPVDTDLFRAIERAAHDRDPGALVTTPMFTAASDRPTYRKLGIVTYGIDPFQVESAEHQKMMHGNDERISVENLGWGTRFIYDILRYAQ